MKKIIRDNKLLVATNNKGKIEEIKKLFLSTKIDLFFIPDFNIEEPIEDGKTFEENALIKAKYYNEKTGITALADDSGICIEALNGDPGIYSANWAGEEKDFNVAINIIERKFTEKKICSSKAYFVCSLALYDNGYNQDVFTEYCHGHVNFPIPSMNKYGFGYDAIFTPNGYNQSFSEMKIEDKLSISARYAAFKKFMDVYFV